MEVVAITPESSEESAKELVLKMLEESERSEKACAMKVLSCIKAVEMAAKDLHYRAKGEAFYSEHLLADLGWAVGRLTDDFIEVYYLGDKGWEAPFMSSVYSDGAGRLFTVCGQLEENAGTEFWARRLLKICEALVSDVEEAKKTLTTKAGTQAALDDISKQTLQVVGLLKRNLK